MESVRKDKSSDIEVEKWSAIKRLIINQIAVCKMMSDFTINLENDDFFQIPPDFNYANFKAGMTTFFEAMKVHYPVEEGESEEYAIDVESFTKNLITKTGDGNFFSKKRVLHLLQIHDHKKACAEVTDFLKLVQREQPVEVEVVLKYIMPQQDEIIGKRQRKN